MSLIKYIDKVFKGGYDTIYIMVDIHNTILRPSFNHEEKFEYFPYSIDVLKILSLKRNVRLILWTSSYEDKIKDYLDNFSNNGIFFDYVNENPEYDNDSMPFACFDKKFYYDIGIDDKFGFDAENDWKEIYDYLIQ
ncbi:MAG: hypothetical protein IKT40_12075 [Bacilli bacterium]|nr:hypothetical protein [Bacilli bacterium]